MKKYKLNIPAALQQRNLTRRALAKRMKVTEPSVTSYIQGNPTIDKIYAIAEALECSVLDLFFPEESPTAALDPLSDVDFSDAPTPSAPSEEDDQSTVLGTFAAEQAPPASTSQYPYSFVPVPILVTMPPITCPHCNEVIVLTPNYISTPLPKDSEE